MRIKVNIMITIFALWILAGCSSSPEPDEILTHYLNALGQGNYQAAYNYIAGADRAVKTAAAYAKENAGTSTALLAEAFKDKCSFTIREIAINGNTATVAVVRSMPDVRAILGSIAGDNAAAGFTEKDLMKLSAKEISAKLKGKEIPVVTTQESYIMVKEAADWRIYFDWKKQTEEKTRQDKIESLLSEANQLRKINNLLAAVDKYNQVLALDNDLPQALAEKAEIEKEIGMLQEKQEYFKQIELQDIRIEKQKARGTDAIKDSIVGTIINKGDKALARVKIAVYFLDQEGREIDYPALATDFFFRQENQPLTPMSRRDFGFTLEGYAPPAWAGKVTVKVADLEFDTRERSEKKPIVPGAATSAIAPVTTTAETAPPVAPANPEQ